MQFGAQAKTLPNFRRSGPVGSHRLASPQALRDAMAIKLGSKSVLDRFDAPDSRFERYASEPRELNLAGIPGLLVGLPMVSRCHRCRLAWLHPRSVARCPTAQPFTKAKMLDLVSAESVGHASMIECKSGSSCLVSSPNASENASP